MKPRIRSCQKTTNDDHRLSPAEGVPRIQQIQLNDETISGVHHRCAVYDHLVVIIDNPYGYCYEIHFKFEQTDGVNCWRGFHLG